MKNGIKAQDDNDVAKEQQLGNPKNDFDSIALRLSNNTISLLPRCEAPWSHFSFDICAWTSNPDTLIDVGTMDVSKLNIGEVFRQKLSLFDAFDMYTQEAHECYCAVFDDDGNIREPFWDDRHGLDDFLCNDFHFLERIEIDERYKGHGIAGVATRIYLENFANYNDVAYFKAFPLQHEMHFEKKPYKRAFKGSYETCCKKLCKHYEQLGFRRIGKSQHFFFTVDDFLEKNQQDD